MTVPFPRRVGDEPAPVSAPAPSPAVTSISPGAASPAPNGTLLVLSMGAVARRTVVIVGTAATVLALLAFTWYARQVLLV
ncbi:MAG: hypothetical protein MUF21_12585, partial [Gemmatimonadaceae bacterium]|nr:hypothetical protein [Gemmatimonadaceae bacterium]